MKRYFVILAMAVLAACATPPQSLDEGLAAAEGQVTGLEQSAAAAVASGTLKPAAAQQVLAIADEAVAAITAAKAAEASGDLTTAQGKLATATALLTQLATYLQAQGVK